MADLFQKHFRPSLYRASGLKTDEMGAFQGGAVRIQICSAQLIVVGVVGCLVQNIKTPLAAFPWKRPHLLH